MRDGQPVSSREITFLCLLTVLNVVNFVDRQLLASFANFIVPDLGLTNTQFGLLTGFAFILFYATMGLFMGALADLVHRPRLIAAGLALWSALTAASGAARGFASLAVPRMLIGVGVSLLIIFAGFFGLGAFYGPTFSTVQELVPPQIRATVVAFYILMLNLIGLGVGITAGGWLIDHLTARGVSQPYSWTLLVFTVLSFSATPLFYLAGRRFRGDRERLFTATAAAA